jgi:Haem-degrading
MAGAQTLLTERGISLNAALDAAKAGLERCRVDGYKVTVTVLNRHARTAVVLSEDGVNPHTIEGSMRKASMRSRRYILGSCAKRGNASARCPLYFDAIAGLCSSASALASGDARGLTAGTGDGSAAGT